MKFSKNKKIEIIWDSVLEEVLGDKDPKNVKAIKIKNVKTIHSRIENLNLTYDFIISRAVTNFTDFVKNTKKLKRTKVMEYEATFWV